jgi:hypothetical protein
MKLKIKMGNSGSAEIVGAILLLAMAVAAFSVIYMNVLSDDGPSPESYATIAGKMELGEAIFEHRRGEGIDINSIVRILKGNFEEEWTVAQLLDWSASNGDNIWDIGERLVYPNATGWHIEATIIDSTSNEIILRGVLQEGYVPPAFGMGGIWHFNESYWDGTPKEVEDTSGNHNHGTAHNGANTVANAASVRSGHFDGIDDYVLVPDHVSLHITEAITVEAWIYPTQINPFITNASFGAKFAYNPKIIPVSGDIYAVISGWGQVKHSGVLATMEILPNGSVNEIPVDNYFEFDDWAYKPDIVHVSGNYYAVAFSSKNKSAAPGEIKIVKITPDGNISTTIYDQLTYDYQDGMSPDLIHVSGDIFALVYTDEDEDGWLKIINITLDGSINGIVSSYEFDTSDCIDPFIINITDNIYAIAYSGPNKDGFIKTINISSDGTIISEEDYFEFDIDEAFDPDIVHIGDDVYGIAYSGPSQDGILKTIRIQDDGSIYDDIFQSSLTFESSDECYNSRIIKFTDTSYAIVYSTGDYTGSSEGRLILVEIASNGTISDTFSVLLDEIGERTNKFFEPDIIRISQSIMAIVYRESTPHEGKITTIYIPNDLIPISERGIVKSGAASLYANTTALYGSINGPGQMLELPINANAWNHVVLTYDKTTIRLYSNFDGVRTPGVDYAEMPYNQSINENDKDLLFGYMFSGLIDEIGIFDHAITEAEILDHQTCIGCYEVE